MEFIKIIKKIAAAREPEESKTIISSNQSGNVKKRFALIKVYLNNIEGDLPMTEIYIGCRRIVGKYEIIREFEEDKEAKNFAIQQGIEISFD